MKKYLMALIGSAVLGVASYSTVFAIKTYTILQQSPK